MNKEERQKRIQELEGVISQANRELAYLGAGGSLGRAVKETMADIAAGETYEARGADLCEQLVAGLNALNEGVEGVVSLRSDSLTISTGVGTVTYDPDAQEWYFLGRS